MGTVFSCNKCDIASTASIFTFSDDLVLKITEGILPPPEKETVGQTRDLNDREWMEKIKCIDSVHTDIYSLDNVGFTRMLHNLEHLLSDDGAMGKCEKEKIMDCYKENPDCILKCNKAVEEFLDCLDMKRLQAMKKYKANKD